MSDIVERLRNQSILDVWHPIMLEAADDIERQRGIISATIEDLQYLKNKQIEAAAEIEKLRAALAFYADKDTWRSSTSYMCGHIGETRASMDKGEKARAAAAAYRETGE